MRVPAGGFVAAPPNVAHSFANEGAAEARFLNLHAPDTGFVGRCAPAVTAATRHTTSSTRRRTAGGRGATRSCPGRARASGSCRATGSR